MHFYKAIIALFSSETWRKLTIVLHLGIISVIISSVVFNIKDAQQIYVVLYNIVY